MQIRPFGYGLASRTRMSWKAFFAVLQFFTQHHIFSYTPLSQSGFFTRTNHNHDWQKSAVESPNEEKYCKPHVWSAVVIFIFTFRQLREMRALVNDARPGDSFFLYCAWLYHLSPLFYIIFLIDTRISFWSRYPDQGLERRWIRWVGRVSVLFMHFQ